MDRFRKLIRSGMEHRRWTQYRLAKEAGVPAITISRFLRVKRGLSAKTLAKILDALERTPNDRP